MVLSVANYFVQNLCTKTYPFLPESDFLLTLSDKANLVSYAQLSNRKPICLNNYLLTIQSPSTKHTSNIFLPQ